MPLWPLLLVDDDRLLLDATCHRIGGALPETTLLAFTRGADALAATEGKPLGLAILDIDMPGMSGLELASRLRARSPELPILFLTGTAKDNLTAEFERVGAVAWLRKPVSGQVLLQTISKYALRARDAT